MSTLAALFGLLMMSLGLVAMASPSTMFRFGQGFLSQGGLYAAMLLRLAAGVVLLMAAPASRFPAVLLVLGVIIFLSGVITPFIGV